MAILGKCVSRDMEGSGQSSRIFLLPHVEACLRELNDLYGPVGLNTLENAIEIERSAWVLAGNGFWKQAR